MGETTPPALPPITGHALSIGWQDFEGQQKLVAVIAIENKNDLKWPLSVVWDAWPITMTVLRGAAEEARRDTRRLIDVLGDPRVGFGPTGLSSHEQPREGCTAPDCDGYPPLCRCGKYAEQPKPEQPPNQREVLAWAIGAFGPVANDRKERAARLVEEAIEVCQIEGVDPSILGKITERVYSRPPGTTAQEVGGVWTTLAAYSECVGVDMEAAAQTEWERVLSKPKDWWTRKHAEKVAAGTANVSAITPPPALPTLTGARELAGEAEAKASTATEGVWRALAGPSSKSEWGVYPENGKFLAVVDNKANADFIAYARSAVPKMATTIRHLCEQIERMTATLRTGKTANTVLVDALNAAKLRADQLEEALREIVAPEQVVGDGIEIFKTGEWQRKIAKRALSASPTPDSTNEPTDGRTPMESFTPERG